MKHDFYPAKLNRLFRFCTALAFVLVFSTGARSQCTTPYYTDSDFDGYGSGSVAGYTCNPFFPPFGNSFNDDDCDDSNPLVSPLMIEICDNLDNDCDGTADDGVLTLAYYTDADGDGFGDVQAGLTCQLTPPAGTSFVNGDCNDSDAGINPAELEACNGIDDNCNGQIDEGWDLDNDGYTACTGDCDDLNPFANPGETEICDYIDNDCNGLADDGASPITYYTDNDLDGFGSTVAGSTCDVLSIPLGSAFVDGDCDDNNFFVSPIMVELCDGIDNDCDGSVDEDAGFDYYVDNDGDGFGTTLAGTTCDILSIPAGHSLFGDDCDDTDPLISPIMLDYCDGQNNDCDGSIDEDAIFVSYYTDADGDGWGGAAAGLTCNPFDIPAGTVLVPGDCDDAIHDVHPFHAESCDGLDNDCDGAIDEGLLDDNDADGYSICTGDCDDADASVNPGATEVCDGIDNNCDGVVPAGEEDGDSDGYAVCAGDCNDADASINPAANEVCDEADNDCDGSLNEGFDADADSYTTCGGDCDDTDASINPAAIETCDGTDNDCDGSVDEGCPAPCDTDDFITYGHGAYGNCNSNVGSYTAANFDAAFPNDLVLGCNNTLTLTSAAAVCNFLPSGGQPRAINANYTDPTNNLRNTFASQLTALALTLGFDAYDEAFTDADGNLADLYVTTGTFAGMTVQQVFDLAEAAFGGCNTSPYTVQQLFSAVAAINDNFEGGDDDGYLSCTPPSAKMAWDENTNGAFISTLYPNPAQDRVTVELNSATAMTFDIRLMDIAGRVISSTAIDAVSGINRVQLDVAQLSAGIYLVNIQTTTGSNSVLRLSIE